jgi:hypothetical protein
MKILLIFWSDPCQYFLIKEITKKFKKKNITLISKKKIENKLIKFNFHKYCKHIEIIGSDLYLLKYLYYFYFCAYSFFYAIFFRPNVIIFYNKFTIPIFLFLRLFLKIKYIYHNFDYDILKTNFSFSAVFDVLEDKLAKYFDYLIFSHPKRVKFFNLKKKLNPNSFKVMFNSLPKKKQKIKKLTKKKYIYWFGSISEGHSLENIIKSLEYLDNNYFLIINGVVINNIFYVKLLNLIKNKNLKKRIFIKLMASDKQIIKNLKLAHLGLALYENNGNLSHRFMGAASQKINAYAKYNMPCLVSNTIDFREFSSYYKFSKCVDNENPKKIALTIKKVLKKNNFKKMTQNARNSHIKYLNFEEQFKSMQQLLLK